MATTQEMLSEIQKIQSDNPGNIDLARHDSRFKRDKEVLEILNRIHNSPSIDRDKYIKAVISEAKEVVERNKSALLKLKDLRENPDTNPNDIKALFDDPANAELIKARAYMVLGAGLTNNQETKEAKLFTDVLDKSALDKEDSTYRLIDKVKNAVAATDSTLDTVHQACYDAASEEIDLIYKEFNRIKDEKEKAAKLPPKNQGKGQNGGNPGEQGKTDLSTPMCAKFGFSYESYSSTVSENSDSEGHSSSSTTIVGARLTKVSPDSAAAKAGLTKGSIITSFNGIQIRNSVDLDRALESTEINKSYAFQVHTTDGKDIVGSIKSSEQRSKSFGLGITFERHRDSWSLFDWKMDTVNAVHLADVPVSSPAYKAGLRQDMVITTVNGTVITHSTQFTKLVQEALANKKTIKFDLFQPVNGTSSITIDPSLIDFSGQVDENKELKR